jgi:hypothetical protein
VNSFSPDDDQAITLAAWQALGQDQHSQIAAPMNALFADAANGDLHAASATAQQVDAGTSAVAAVTTQDFEGTPRPQGAGYDIGCYERSGSVGVLEGKTPGRTTAFCSGGLVHVSDGRTGDLLVFTDASGRRLASQVLSGGGTSVPAPDGVFFLTLFRRSEVVSTVRLVNVR